MRIQFTEDTFERALIDLFSEMGYNYQCGYDLERDESDPCLQDVLHKWMPKLNPRLGSEGLDNLYATLADVDGNGLLQRNERFLDWLQNGVSVEDNVNGEYRHVTARLVDYDNIDNNDFTIVNQWTVDEFSRKRCDIVVFVNGLPVVVIELKSPSNDSVGNDDAYNQIKTYQREIPCLFTYNCFNVISDMLTSRAGTLTSNNERYMEWKSKDGEYESSTLADYETFFRGIFQREHLIDIMQNFICYNSEENKIKVMAGYHQYFAVNKALTKARKAVESDGKIGVFWHTQGSGKSLSMMFLSHLLIKNFKGVTIVVVTDRKDLDQQLFSTFLQYGDFMRTTPENASSREELVELLKNRQSGGIVFTTIQKFEESDEPLSDRKNIIVMTDEAHRSQYGGETWDEKSEKMKKGMALKMREALPNASFIGFTGTPISTSDKDTREVFGDYIDVYDMTQSVEDGATRPVYYESRVVKLNLDETVTKELDKEFDKLAELGLEEEEVRETKHNYSHLERVLSSDATIEALVKDIIKHYEENRADLLTGKAMIVAMTRKIGIKIYKKILELRPDWTEKVKVVMTSSNTDTEEMRDIIGNERYRKELAAKFKKNDDPMKIAIVRDMWLTGFDVPSLATMYVFKAMSGYNLMQAIARVNRVFPGKEGGLIVDYIGIAQALKRAMKEYTSRDIKRFGDPDIAKTALVRFEEEMDICREQIHGFDYSGFFANSDMDKANALKGGLNFMLAVEREQKRKTLVEHSMNLHNSQTLCRSMLTIEQKTEAAFFDALRVMITRCTQTRTRNTVKEINDHILDLLEMSIKSDGVISLVTQSRTEFSLFDENFAEEIAKMKEKNVAMELLKRLLRERIRKTKRENVVQSDKFSDMLNDSLNKYLKGMLTNEEVIKELIELAKQIHQEEKAGDALGLNVQEKAFYDALSKPEVVKGLYTDEQFVAFAKELTEVLQKNRTIDWRHKEAGRAKMRVLVKRMLKKHGYPPEGRDEALESVIAQCDNWADNEDNFNEE